MSDLREDMEELVEFVAERLRQGESEHWQLCKLAADEFDLWDAEARFPFWLSRVVEGAVRDHQEGG